MIRLSAAALVACGVMLVSCSDSSSGDMVMPNGTPTPTPTPSSSPTSVGTAITAALADGSLPTLDVTTSVTGLDGNVNGIRDDIDVYINALSDTEVRKTALRQQAVVLQSSLNLNTADTNVVVAQAQKITASVQCLYAQYPEAQATARLNELEKYTVNTKERFVAYARYNSAISGNVTLSVEGTGCAQ